jgi:hypothetical protein
MVLFYRANLAAEHIKANLLLCNAAVRLQAGGTAMSRLWNIRQEVVVAKVIEFYIPNNFRKKTKRTTVEQRGQVIEFDSLKKKSA